MKLFKAAGCPVGETFVRGRGAWLERADGKKFLDFTCGIAVTNLGHSHPAVIAAAKAQLDNAFHIQYRVGTHPPMERFLKLFGRRTPTPSLDSVFLINSGSEAVEHAIRVARCATGRSSVMAFQDAYHGRTLLAASLTSSKNVIRAGMHPSAGGILHAPFASEESQVDAVMAHIADLCASHCPPEQLAAVIIEPVLGEGGYLPAAPSFLPRLRRFARESGAMLVVDEVQSGYGRTGHFWAMDAVAAGGAAAVDPDVVVFAKGVANGLPLSGIVARSALADAVPVGGIGGTYGGSCVPVAAACAVLETLDDALLAGVRERAKRLSASAAALRGVARVRGVGYMVAVELADQRKGAADAVMAAARERGLLLLGTSRREAIRLMPPLVATEEDLATGVRLLGDALQACATRA